jgi:hypothetical protein
MSTAFRRRIRARSLANSIFAHLPEHAIEPLQDWSFFWTWDAAKNLVRWMTSFATTEADVARFADGVHHFTRPITRDEDNVAASSHSPNPGWQPRRVHAMRAASKRT